MAWSIDIVGRGILLGLIEIVVNAHNFMKGYGIAWGIQEKFSNSMIE